MTVADEIGERQTFQLGFDAFYAYADSTDNPYTQGTAQHGTWFAGWNAGWLDHNTRDE